MSTKGRRRESPSRVRSTAGQARSDVVVALVRAIPEGFVTTYGDIDPRAPRHVGRVLATTHEDIPWHRVVRADGSIPKGRRQRELLVREGVPMRGQRVDLRHAHVPVREL